MGVSVFYTSARYSSPSRDCGARSSVVHGFAQSPLGELLRRKLALGKLLLEEGPNITRGFVFVTDFPVMWDFEKGSVKHTTFEMKTDFYENNKTRLNASLYFAPYI